MGKHKTLGPDEIRMELYKSFSEHQLKEFLSFLNEWWLSANISQEALLARVVLIYKKGDKSQFANYRQTYFAIKRHL